MKNIGLIGYGNVGETTLRYLKDTDRKFFIFDQHAERLKAGRRTYGTNMEGTLDALIVCITVPTWPALEVRKYLSDALSKHASFLRGGAPIIVRSTVPPGTCNLLEESFPDNPVMAWPEFSTEASMRLGYQIKAPYLGIPAHLYHADKRRCLQVANLLLDPCELSPDLISSTLLENTTVEFLKLAWNVRRAADVLVFNDLAHSAARLGIDPVIADWTVENAAPSPPHYSTLSFGGSCLEKSLRMYDAATHSTLGELLRQENHKGPRRAVKLLLEGRKLLELPAERPVILGLQENPGTRQCANSPALKCLKTAKWDRLPVFVDWDKDARNNFLSFAVRGLAKATIAEPQSALLSSTNSVLLAQKSVGTELFNSLRTILQGSSAPVKVIVNGCGAPFTERETIELQKWGGVFIDAIELRRMKREVANP